MQELKRLVFTFSQPKRDDQKVKLDHLSGLFVKSSLSFDLPALETFFMSVGEDDTFSDQKPAWHSLARSTKLKSFKTYISLSLPLLPPL